MVAGPLPARYAVTIGHRRRDPVDYGFRRRASTWLVDLDDLPTLPGVLGRLCRFDAADHLGDPTATLRANLDSYLARHAVPAPSRILMLANPRLLGYVFNPLSVFYCYDGTDRLTHVVAEVHNTYGDRHRYLVEPDAAGRARTAKEFYVSPFYPVDGEYTMAFPEPADDLAVTVTLRRPGDRPFVATMTGRRAAGRSSLWRALRAPLATRAVMAGIRRHGITLYVKGLRPYPRPPAPSDTAAPESAPLESAPLESAPSRNAR